MRVGRSEALDLLRKWRDEDAVLRCDFSFALFAATLRGRVLSVSKSEVKLISDDRTSELTLRFKEGMEFGYGDSRNFPEEIKFVEAGLVVGFPRADSEAGPDFIAFIELVS